MTPPADQSAAAVLNPTRADLAQLRRDNAMQPRSLAEIPRERWPVELPTTSGAKRLRVLRNRCFLVQVFEEPIGALRLSVNRTEWDHKRRRFADGISWDDLQDLKNQAGYGDKWAVEIFPPADRVVNVANMRHVWIVPNAPPFGWNIT